MYDGFDRVMAIDWSGAASSGNQRIYVAERVDDGLVVKRAAGRTAVHDFLRGEELETKTGWERFGREIPPIREERVLVGIDFAFSFPAGFTRLDLGPDWEWNGLCRRLADIFGNYSSPDWEKLRLPNVDLHGKPPRYRDTETCVQEAHGRAPAVSYATSGVAVQKQVGKSSISGILMIRSLLARARHDIAVWPLHGDADSTKLVLAEVYPAIWLGDARKSNLPDRYGWAKERGLEDETLAAVTGSSDAFDAALAAVEMPTAVPNVPVDPAAREGWILGCDPPTRSSGP